MSTEGNSLLVPKHRALTAGSCYSKLPKSPVYPQITPSSRGLAGGMHFPRTPLDLTGEGNHRCFDLHLCAPTTRRHDTGLQEAAARHAEHHPSPIIQKALPLLCQPSHSPRGRLTPVIHSEQERGGPGCRRESGSACEAIYLTRAGRRHQEG